MKKSDEWKGQVNRIVDTMMVHHRVTCHVHQVSKLSELMKHFLLNLHVCLGRQVRNFVVMFVLVFLLVGRRPLGLSFCYLLA